MDVWWSGKCVWKVSGDCNKSYLVMCRLSEQCLGWRCNNIIWYAAWGWMRRHTLQLWNCLWKCVEFCLFESLKRKGNHVIWGLIQDEGYSKERNSILWNYLIYVINRLRPYIVNIVMPKQVFFFFSEYIPTRAYSGPPTTIRYPSIFSCTGQACFSVLSKVWNSVNFYNNNYLFSILRTIRFGIFRVSFKSEYLAFCIPLHSRALSSEQYENQLLLIEWNTKQ